MVFDTAEFRHLPCPVILAFPLDVVPMRPESAPLIWGGLLCLKIGSPCHFPHPNRLPCYVLGIQPENAPKMPSVKDTAKDGVKPLKTLVGGLPDTRFDDILLIKGWLGMAKGDEEKKDQRGHYGADDIEPQVLSVSPCLQVVEG